MRIIGVSLLFFGAANAIAGGKGAMPIADPCRPAGIASADAPLPIDHNVPRLLQPTPTMEREAASRVARGEPVHPRQPGDWSSKTSRCPDLPR